MKKNLSAAYGLLAALGLTAVGCTTHIPHSASMGAPVDVGNVKNIGRVEGESSAQWFLMFGPTGDDSLKAAVADALSKKGGDALVNMTVDRSVTAFPHMSYPLFLKVKTTVTGTAINTR